jgi:hypothetical protein
MSQIFFSGHKMPLFVSVFIGLGFLRMLKITLGITPCKKLHKHCPKLYFVKDVLKYCAGEKICQFYML